MEKSISIKTDRLILRNFVPGDLKALHEYAIRGGEVYWTMNIRYRSACFSSGQGLK